MLTPLSLITSISPQKSKVYFTTSFVKKIDFFLTFFIHLTIFLRGSRRVRI